MRYTSLVLRATRLTNLTPFSIAMPTPHFIPKNSPMIDATIECRYYDYYNAVNKRSDPIDYLVAKASSQSSIPWDIMVPGVVLTTTRIGGKLMKAPTISGAKKKGMLRSAAFMLSTEGLPPLDPREANYLAKGGLMNKKGQEDKTGVITGETPLATMRRLRAAHPIIGLFGAFDDRGNIHSAVRVSDATLRDDKEMLNTPSIELAPSGARSDIADDPFSRTRLKELGLTVEDDDDDKKDRVKQKQIPYGCRVAAFREFDQTIRIVCASDEEIGLFFASLDYIRKHQMPVGGKRTVGNTGDLDFDYDVFSIDEATGDETYVGAWEAMRDDPKSLVTTTIKAFEGHMTAKRASFGQMATLASTTHLSDPIELPAPKAVGRKPRAKKAAA